MYELTEQELSFH